MSIDRVKDVISNEPILITGFVEALIVLLVAFGLELSPEQIGAILGFVTIITSVIGRAFVTPVSKMRKQGVDI